MSNDPMNTRPDNSGEKGHVALVSNSAHTMLGFRGRLISELVAQGWRVSVVGPLDGGESGLSDIGANVVEWKLARSGINPVGEIISLLRLRRILKNLQPDLVHSFQIKPYIYGTIASRFGNVKTSIGTLTGLGYAFTHPSVKAKSIRQIVSVLMRLSSRWSTKLFVLNTPDRKLISQLVGSGQSVELQAGGEGVDLERFNAGSIDPRHVAEFKAEFELEDELVMLVVGRLLHSKGFSDVVEAQARLDDLEVRTRLIIVGEIDHNNPDAISEQELQTWIARPGVSRVGYRGDIRPLMLGADVMVVPSRFREGFPVVAMEASSLGVPVIASNVPGCSEAVIDGVNGILVPPSSPQSIAEAIVELSKSPELRQRLKSGGVAMARDVFSSEIIVNRLIDQYSSLVPSDN